MALLSLELKRLHDTFNDFITKPDAFTVLTATAFLRDLKLAQAKAALIDLGVDETVFDVPIDEAVFGSAPPENVVPFPRGRILRDRSTDGSVA